jgi:hypothetical protein
VKVDRTLVIPLLRGLTRTLGTVVKKVWGSVRLQIVEGYVFYPSTLAQALVTAAETMVNFVHLGERRFK